MNPLRMALLKGMDRHLGSWMARWLPVPRSVGGTPTVRAVLVIRPGGIGDAIQLLPMLQILHARLPAARITVLAERRNAGAFALGAVPAAVLRYDVFAELFRALRGQYDVVIDTEQWHRLSAVIARLVRAPVKIGFASNERRRLFTAPVPYVQEDYEAEVFSRLLGPLGIGERFSDDAPWLSVPPQARERVAAFALPPPGSYVVLFPGASIPQRRWETERFRLLAAAIRERGWQVLVVGGREDCAAAQAICRDGVGRDMAGKTNLAESAAILEGAALLVSGDSGILHIGAGLGIPTVSLFGPGIAKKWAPRGTRHTVLNLQLPCSPCTLYGTTPFCPQQVACLDGIDVAAVVAAVKKQLDTNGRKECSPPR